MNQDELITVHYEVWEGDISLTPKIGIMEVLKIEFVDHQWVVTSNEPGAPSQWIGRDGYRQIAILNYLKARLGHYEIDRIDTIK